MDLTPHVETLQHQLLAAAEAGGEQARELAGLLVNSLDPIARLMLLDALADASDEITRELAPGSVEVRLRGRDPEFVVTHVPNDVESEVVGFDDVTATSPAPASGAAPADQDDGGTSRITLRLPDQLKIRIEQAAGRDGVSVNSWLVRTLAAAVETTGRPSAPPRRSSGGKRITGWARQSLPTHPLPSRRVGRSASVHPPDPLTSRRRRKETTMPRFDTPRPIRINVDVVGNVRVNASDRDDTIVTIEPLDPSKSADVKAARDTVVEHTDGELVVRTPKHWTRFTPFGGGESVDVTIEVPSGSRLEASTALGDIHSEGELGPCRVKTAMGHLRLDQTGDLRARTAFGDVTVDRIAGAADVATSSGELRIGEITGAAIVKNSNGPTEVGGVDGDARVKSANGDIVLRRAGASTVAKTSNGDVRVLDVSTGTIVMESAAGDLEVGVRQGVAVWLDLHTRFGAVRNDLDATEGPGPSDGKVEVRATTSAGDIVIRRATGTRAPDID